jgi:hypothetical protein
MFACFSFAELREDSNGYGAFWRNSLLILFNTFDFF